MSAFTLSVQTDARWRIRLGETAVDTAREQERELGKRDNAFLLIKLMADALFNSKTTRRPARPRCFAHRTPFPHPAHPAD